MNRTLTTCCSLAAVAAVAATSGVLGAARSAADPPPAPGACAQHDTAAGSLEVCPARARVGALLTVRGSLSCWDGAAGPTGVVFLGPRTYVGRGGGGTLVRYRVETSAFEATFRVPATYPAAASSGGRALPVWPGRGYAFATLPGRACRVAFTVTSPPVSHVAVWTTPALPGITCGAGRGPAATAPVRCQATPAPWYHPRGRHGRFALRLASSGRATVAPVGRWPYAQSPARRVATLAPAGSWSRAGVRCRTGRRSVTCTNRSRHGFSLGAWGYQRF